MKPRPVESEVLTKARNMAARLDALEKAKCDCGKEPCECKSCPKCGGKMAKMGCMKAGCGSMQKADEQTKEKITEVNPHFLTETGGQTRTAYYSTRDRPIETEDHKPKRAKDGSKVSLESLGSRMNPHEGTGVDREDTQGGSPVKKSPASEMREAAEQGAPMVCGLCGGTEDTGCLAHVGMDLMACPKFKPLR